MSRNEFVPWAAVLTAGLASLTGAFAQGEDKRPDRGGNIEWREDIETAFADAARTGRPVVIYFTADW